MAWFRKRSAASRGSVVDVVLGIVVHSPNILVGDIPEGDRLKEIAGETMGRQDPKLTLASDAYVRLINAHGTDGLSIQLMRAQEDARGLMEGLLGERGLDARAYGIQVWSEELSQDIWEVWAVAARE
jgi:hypothetical protein